MKKMLNLRATAATISYQAVELGQSLNMLLPMHQSQIIPRDRPLLQELCFGVLRTLPRLEWFIEQLMERPLTGKLRPLHYLLLIGCYQLLHTRIPPHAVLSETVKAAVELKNPSFKGLVNGVLRQFQNRQAELLAASKQQPCRHLHPQWLFDRIQQIYPQHWQQIIDSNNLAPPMWLRINRRKISRDEYLQLLWQNGKDSVIHPDYPDALRLIIPTAVKNLPGFTQGWFSVQDAGAQQAALLLDPHNNEDILDLCAAPGGKTCHILEIAPRARVIALDCDPIRLSRVTENLDRLGLQAETRRGDGRRPNQWHVYHQFDRILIDAPCTASGVIRRHPDIKWLRRTEDAGKLASMQAQLLTAGWSQLKPGGTLLYSTCSLFPEENQEQINAFLANNPDAQLAVPMQQLLPAVNQTDGFFYAKLTKSV